MSQAGIKAAIAAFLLCCGTPLMAQDAAAPRSVAARAAVGGGNPFWYDGRDDARDFPTNGFFPGDFAANPAWAWLGAAGIFGSTPDRGYDRNPPPVVIRSQADRASCVRHRRPDNVPYRC